MIDFKVNDYITLRLERNDTNIYIKGNYFRQCKYLLIDIPINWISSFDNINSIDEAAEHLDHSLDPFIDEDGNLYRVDRIPPEVEFWGHCSNLQVWHENNYDTRLLHRNLAFPLLKRLNDEGDPLAKRVFKEEIAKRLESNHPTVLKFLIVTGLIYNLDKEELEAVLSEPTDEFINSFITLFDEEFKLYIKVYKRHGKGFPFLKKGWIKLDNGENLTLCSILRKIQDQTPEILKRIVQDLVLKGNLRTLLYLISEHFIYSVLDSSEEVKKNIAKQLLSGLEIDDKWIFNLSFNNLISLNYGSIKEKKGYRIREIKLDDFLNLKKQMEGFNFPKFLKELSIKLLKYHDTHYFFYNYDLITKFYSSFKNNAVEALHYLYQNSIGELRSLASKSFFQLKSEGERVSKDLDIQIDLDTIKNLEINEIKTMIPDNPGAVIIEKILFQL